jgi:flagellar basal body-associated protein FliL
MAEENEVNEEGTEDKKKKKGLPTVVIIAAVAVLMLGAGMFVGKMMFGGGGGSDQVKKEETVKDKDAKESEDNKAVKDEKKAEEEKVKEKKENTSEEKKRDDSEKKAEENKTEDTKESEDGQTEVKKKKTGKGNLRLEEFLVNLNDPLVRRYVKFVINLRLTDVNYVEEIKADENIIPEIRDKIFELVSDKSYTDLKSSAGKIMLKEEIMISVNEILKDSLKVEPVIKVMFSKFILQ